MEVDITANIKAADGAYMLNGEQFNYTKDELGRPVLNVQGGGQGGGEGDFKADGSTTMTGNLQMNGNAIMGVKSISNTDSGLAIESNVDINNHKISSLLDPTDEQDAATKKYVDEHSVLGEDGKIDSELDMNEHAIVNVHKIATNGPAPLYIGPTVESEETNAPRLTGATDGSAAFVKASTQDEYVPVSVGTPTSVNHATSKEYVDGKVGAVQASALLKSGGTMVGKLKLTAEPTDDNDAVTKKYVDDNASGSSGDDYISKTTANDLTKVVILKNSENPAKMVMNVFQVNADTTDKYKSALAVGGCAYISHGVYIDDLKITGEAGQFVMAGNNGDVDRYLTTSIVSRNNRVSNVDSQELLVKVNNGVTIGGAHRTSSTEILTKEKNIELATNFYDTDGTTVTSTTGVVIKGVADPTDDTCAVNYSTLKALLPAFTEADNGKVLGVVNGALAWVDK